MVFGARFIVRYSGARRARAFANKEEFKDE